MLLHNLYYFNNPTKIIFRDLVKFLDASLDISNHSFRVFALK